MKKRPTENATIERPLLFQPITMIAEGIFRWVYRMKGATNGVIGNQGKLVHTKFLQLHCSLKFRLAP